MTQQVTMYRSVSGTVHETEYQSLQDDLLTMLVKHGQNSAEAGKLVQSVCGSIESLSQLGDVVLGLSQRHPSHAQPSGEQPTPPT